MLPSVCDFSTLGKALVLAATGWGCPNIRNQLHFSLRKVPIPQKDNKSCLYLNSWMLRVLWAAVLLNPLPITVVFFSPNKQHWELCHLTSGLSTNLTQSPTGSVSNQLLISNSSKNIYPMTKFLQDKHFIYLYSIYQVKVKITLCT